MDGRYDSALLRRASAGNRQRSGRSEPHARAAQHLRRGDINALYLQTLRNLEFNRPCLKVACCDVNEAQSFPIPAGGYNTVICLNVIEHVDDDRMALNNIGAVLAPQGRALLLVPQWPWKYGTLDEVLGHRRRYTRGSLDRLAAQCGFRIKELIEFNRTGSLAWFLNGKLMRRQTFGLIQIWLLDYDAVDETNQPSFAAAATQPDRGDVSGIRPNEEKGADGRLSLPGGA